MTKPTVIDLANASVCYRIPKERVRTFKEFSIKWLRGHITYEQLIALNDVSFTVPRGQALGVIGRNGAGKTTLLKVVAGVLRPTKGSVHVHGALVPLLELGAGFDPELSGRENLFLNGAILGRSRRDMARRIDEIVDFAELRDFIDAPLRTYSTGMVARLGFAIATDIDPDILLIDEVLSVGDVQFQQKCLERIAAFRRRGSTFVLVSHSLQLVDQLCDRVLWLEGGRLVRDGRPSEVLPAFQRSSDGPLPHSAAS